MGVVRIGGHVWTRVASLVRPLSGMAVWHVGVVKIGEHALVHEDRAWVLLGWVGGCGSVNA